MSSDERKIVVAPNPPQPQISDGPWWVLHGGSIVGVLYSFVESANVEYWFLIDSITGTPKAPDNVTRFKRWTADLVKKDAASSLTFRWIDATGKYDPATEWDRRAFDDPSDPPLPYQGVGAVKYRRWKYERTDGSYVP